MAVGLLRLNERAPLAVLHPPADIALRDCGINSFIIEGVATEIGIEPTIRPCWVRPNAVETVRLAGASPALGIGSVAQVA